MNWDVILPGLAALLASLTGLQVKDRDNSQEMTNPDPTAKGQLLYSVTSCSSVGIDELRYDPDPADPTGWTTKLLICGQRYFTLQVRFEGFDQGDTLSARFYLERIRTRLNFPSSNDAINKLGCAWADDGPFILLNNTYDDRVFSVGTIDFMFNACVNEPDTSADDSPIGYIQSVSIASHFLYDSSGSPASTQLNLTVTAT